MDEPNEQESVRHDFIDDAPRPPEVENQFEQPCRHVNPKHPIPVFLFVGERDYRLSPLLHLEFGHSVKPSKQAADAERIMPSRQRDSRDSRWQIGAQHLLVGVLAHSPKHPYRLPIQLYQMGQAHQAAFAGFFYQ